MNKTTPPNDQMISIPSNYINSENSHEICNFSKISFRMKEYIDSIDYKQLPEFQNKPVIDYYKTFVSEFNKLKDEELINPPASIQEFIQYLTTKIVQKACFGIASSWPCTLSNIHPTIEPFVGLLVKILNEVSDYKKLMKFLSFSLFPKIWTIKSCFVNPYLLSICKCFYIKKPGYWALVEKETKEFQLIHKIKETITVVIKGIITGCILSPNGQSVIVQGENWTICEFTPCENEQLLLWPKIFDKKKVPFPLFMSSDMNYYPEVYYNAFYSAITSNDLLILRAIIKSSLKIDYQIIESLGNVFLYGNRVHFLLESVFGMEFEKKEIDIHSVLQSDSLIKYLWVFFASKFMQSYISGFISKLILFIEQSKGYSEALVFNVIKYITMSFAQIPREIHYFVSVLKSFIIIKFNNKGSYYQIVGGLFGEFICKIFDNPNEYISTAVTKHVELKRISTILKAVFIGTIPELLNKDEVKKRLEQHTFKQIEAFLFSLGDFIDPIIKMNTPSKDDLGKSLDKLMHFILKQPNSLSMVIQESGLPEPKYSTQIAWNFITYLIDFFESCIDSISTDIKYEKKAVVHEVHNTKPIASSAKKTAAPSLIPKISLPKLPMYNKSINGKPVFSGFKDGMFDGNSVIQSRSLALGSFDGSSFHLVDEISSKQYKRNRLKRSKPENESTVSDALSVSSMGLELSQPHILSKGDDPSILNKEISLNAGISRNDEEESIDSLEEYVYSPIKKSNQVETHEQGNVINKGDNRTEQKPSIVLPPPPLPKSKPSLQLDDRPENSMTYNNAPESDSPVFNDSEDIVGREPQHDSMSQGNPIRKTRERRKSISKTVIKGTGEHFDDSLIIKQTEEVEEISPLHRRRTVTRIVKKSSDQSPDQSLSKKMYKRAENSEVEPPVKKKVFRRVKKTEKIDNKQI